MLIINANAYIKLNKITSWKIQYSSKNNIIEIGKKIRFLPVT